MAKTNGTGDDEFALVGNATDTEWVLGFVLGAVGDFVVERAQPLGAMAFRFRALVGGREAEDFGDRMLGG